jgi:capsular exopolysaccharide synthesis family protein
MNLDMPAPVASATAYRDLADMIWRRKGWLIVSLMLTMSVGAAYLQVATPIYDVRARLLIQKQGVQLDSSRAWDFADPDFLATQAQILRSPVIVREALGSVEYPAPHDPGADPVAAVIDSLTADPVRGTNVLAVGFHTPYPEQGTKVVERIVECYANFSQSETLRMLGKLGETAKIQELLWQAQTRAKEISETLGTRHPDLRGIQEQITLLEGLLRDRAEADRALAEQQARDRVRAIDGPVFDDKPIWPRPTLLFAVCGVIGLAGGFGLICLLDRLDPKLRSVAEIRSHLGTPIVGRIPVVQPPWNVRKRELFASRVVRECPGSAVAEAFRSLRTQLNRNGGPEQHRVIQVVSPRQGDGKSAIAANLAFSFAQLGRSVIVVDADLRCGKLSRIFDVPAPHGLASVLRDGMSLAQAIQQSPLAEIDVLAAGPEVANPVELLAQSEFANTLSALRDQYEVVIIDTPALLEVTEGSLVAPAADCVLLTLMVQKTLAADAVHAQELLDSLSAKVVGVVANGVQEARSYGYGLETTNNGNGNGNGTGNQRRRSETSAEPVAVS